MTWEEWFHKWMKRLLEPGWDVRLVADPSLAEGYAEGVTVPGNQRATIRYNPDQTPRNDTACHEVCHLLVSHLALAGQSVADVLEGQAKALAEDRLRHDEEETVELLERAFLRAYGEFDERRPIAGAERGTEGDSGPNTASSIGTVNG